jgi:tetratricopeptide (TPR) repeat protein
VLEDGLGVGVTALETESVKHSGDHLSFLITENNSHAAIAKAVEADFDDFVFKPYNRVALQKVLVHTTLEKLNPEKYRERIQAGKDCLFLNLLQDAEKEFESAKGLTKNNSLAHFYSAQVKQLKRELEKAKDDYLTGASSNPVHYRCLMGAFETLFEEGQMHEAYEVLKRIIYQFPENAERLANGFSLAVKTGNFEAIPDFYDILEEAEERTEDLVTHASSALAVNGHYFLKKEQKQDALLSFEKIMKVSPESQKFMGYVVQNLKKYGYEEEAKNFQERWKKPRK